MLNAELTSPRELVSRHIPLVSHVVLAQLWCSHPSAAEDEEQKFRQAEHQASGRASPVGQVIAARIWALQAADEG